MKIKPLILLALIFISVYFPAQGNSRILIVDTIPLSDSNDYVFSKVEIEAKFPGGDKAWRSFLENNLNAAVPVINGAPVGAYTVIIQFIVDKTGKISNIIPLTNHKYGMEDEVVRILKRAPRWEPAIQFGRVVKAYRKQPVTFVIQDDKIRKRKSKD
jgi:periplasmic protein TonB